MPKQLISKKTSPNEQQPGTSTSPQQLAPQCSRLPPPPPPPPSLPPVSVSATEATLLCDTASPN